MKLALLLVASTAHADPRVVIADPDPELHHALETALAPWRVQIVDGAKTDDARIVIWRDGGELVIDDRATGTRERHAARPGDPIADAATALTVKSLLQVEPRSDATAPSLRVALAGGALLDAVSAAHGSLRALIAPWDGALRAGVAAMRASDATIESAGFKGTWARWGVAAAASYSLRWDAWELAPTVELGFVRGTLSGSEDMTARVDHATLPRIAVGVAGMRRFGRFAAGLAVSFAATPGGDTYTKANGMAEIFTPPSSSAEIDLIVSCDLFSAHAH